MHIGDMLQSLVSQRKPVLIAPKKLAPPATTVASTPNNSPQVIDDVKESDDPDDEPIIIVEPTDPDEDRLKAEEQEIEEHAEELAATLAIEATTEVTTMINGSSTEPMKTTAISQSTSGITTDPVLLNQILHALSAKPVKSTPIFSVPVVNSTVDVPPHNSVVTATPTANGSAQQTRLLVASSNVYTIQAQAPIQARAANPQSIMLQSINGLQGARIVASPMTVSPISPATREEPALTTVDSAVAATHSAATAGHNACTVTTGGASNLQQLFTSSPLLSSVLVNCATANLITQLANSISSSMLSFAQMVAIDKQQNVTTQVSELTQMLSALTTLASTLSSSLPSLVNLRLSPVAPPANPILTSLISQLTPNSTTGTPVVSSVIPLANFKFVPGIDRSCGISVDSPINVSVAPNITITPSQSIQIPIVSAAIQGLRVTAPISAASAANGFNGGLSTVTSVATANNNGGPSNRVKRFQCTQEGCGRAFYSRFNLIEHIRTHTGERPFVCPAPGCKSRFKRRRDLADHISIHRVRPDSDGAGPLLALLTEEPGRDDSGIADLSDTPIINDDDDDDEDDDDDDDDDDEDDDDDDDDDSSRAKSEDTPFGTSKSDEQGSFSGGEKVGGRKRKRHFCPFPNCSRSYARRHRLNQHMCQHTGIGPYYCDQPSCSVKYFCASDLDRHKLIHLVPTSGDPLKRHLCPYPGCGKAYSKLNKLREHVRSHTGERPYVCDYPGCNASFIRLYGLKRHQLTHTPLSFKQDDKRYLTILPDLTPSSQLKQLPITSIFPSITSGKAEFNSPHILKLNIQPNVTVSCSIPSQPPQTVLPTLPPLEHAPMTTPIKMEPVTAASYRTKTEVDVADPEEEYQVSPKADESDVKQPPQKIPKTTITTTVNGTLAIKNPLSSRSNKASATPSASAMALKAVVIPGPFGKRRHICPMPGCKKIFPKLNKLREHICRHTGERPYACEECPATFVRMYDLRRHALIHLRKKRNGLLAGL